MNKHRKKAAKRAYKRLAAVLAGAAVISSTMLPGIPLARVQAAVDSSNVNSAPAAKDDSSKPVKGDSPLKAARQQASKYGFDSSRDRFSLQSRTKTAATVLIHTTNGKVYKMELMKTRNDNWRVTGVHQTGRESDSTVGSPVQKVIDNARRFGFNPASDKFSLLSLSGAKATVQVRTGGQTFNVDLVKRANSWEITTIRGIGSTKYPATYIPASMFPSTGTLPSKPVQNAGQTRILFESGNYFGWNWLESTYPSDRSFGILLQDPRGASDSYPAGVLSAIQNIDFSSQFVVYASLGTVSGQGYGIGIEKIIQTGNDYTVTVRTNSPGSGQINSTATQNYDFIALDRSTLDFSDPVTITFADLGGTTLSKYTLSLRY